MSAAKARRRGSAAPFAAVPRQSVPVHETVKRELVFLVADSGMEAMIGTFLGRNDFYRKLGCAPFDFNAKTDIIKAGGHDPGLVKREAGQILNLRRKEFRRAMVVVDNAYAGSPGPDVIRARIAAQLEGIWDQFAVVVIDPELENWFWVDSPDLLKRALVWTRKDDDRTPKAVLEEAGLWQAGADKPTDPKRAVEYLYKQGHTRDATNGIFKRLAAGLPSVRRCTDESFRQLTATLCEWFPSQAPTAAYGTDHAGENEQTERREHTQ
ncbi:hypothetical protein ACFWVC_06050 [Streptomyces sp. NPDC058691]|uniref:methylation-associated defense system protein MAD4 n=1 Tax=Streptomyces sp. NPDC058691 TaxID=3346601 RepID=UPI00366032AE